MGSDDLAQKIYFHNLIGKKGWHISKALFFGKMNSLKIKHLKGFIFLVPEYGNLTGVKTHRDRLENSGEGISEQRVQILILERVEDLIEASDVSWLLTFRSFVRIARKSLKIFSFSL